MNAFFFANNDQMSDEMFATLDCPCCRDKAELYAASELMESEAFISALTNDIKTVFGNVVDLADIVDDLFIAAANFIHPYKDTRMLLAKQSEIEMAALNLAKEHGIKSKGYVNRAVAYYLSLNNECAA
jgi:hypothetical protein